MTGKSKEEIAFELVSKLKGVGVWGENNMDSILDMYAECLEATSGLRKSKNGHMAAHAPNMQAAAPQIAVQPQVAPPLSAAQQPQNTMAPQQIAQQYNQAR